MPCALRAPEHDGCFGVVAGREKVDEAPHPPQLRAARRRDRGDRTRCCRLRHYQCEHHRQQFGPADHGRHFAPADRPVRRGRPGHAEWLQAVGQRREHQRRPAAPPGQAGDPQRQQQREDGHQRLQRADQPGPRGPDAGPVLDAADRRRPVAPPRNTGMRWSAGSATGGLVFEPPSYPNFFSVSLPVNLEMVPFATWVVRPPGQPAADRRVSRGRRPVRRPARGPPPRRPCRRMVSGRVYSGQPEPRRPSRTCRSSKSRRPVAQQEPADRGHRLGGPAQPADLHPHVRGHELHAQDHDRRVRAGSGPGVPEQAEPLQRPGRSWCRTAGSAACRTR